MRLFGLRQIPDIPAIVTQTLEKANKNFTKRLHFTYILQELYISIVNSKNERMQHFASIPDFAVEKAGRI